MNFHFLLAKENHNTYKFGQLASNDLIKQLSISIPPDGEGLPDGKGTFNKGQDIYNHKCAACHGQNLEGNPMLHGPALIGGRGSLNTSRPLKTIESYWPYPTTVFDFIRRAMPFGNPTLSDNEVYSLTKFILVKANIINKYYILDKNTLPKINMPNKKGFNIISFFNE